MEGAPQAGPDPDLLPPGGSVFETYSGKDGPPLMRMFLIQGACEMASKNARITTFGKGLIILIISFLFMANDIKTFMTQRSENIYRQVGLSRSATYGDIDEVYEQYKACMDFDSSCKDVARRQDIYKLDPDHVKEIFHVLKKPDLREIYDKTEIFVRPKAKAKEPTEGTRYMSAFGEVGSYTIFIVITLLLVEQHQQFAKQMTVGLLIVFSYLSVQLKMPKEVNSEENLVIKVFSAMGFLDNLTFFEIGYILKSVLYPSLFNTTLNVSRLVDVEPILEFKKRILDAQKKLTRTFLPLEMITKMRDSDEKYHSHCEAEKKKEEEAKKKEDEKNGVSVDKAVEAAKETGAEVEVAPVGEAEAQAVKEGEEKKAEDEAKEAQTATEGSTPAAEENQLVEGGPSEEEKKAEDGQPAELNLQTKNADIQSKLDEFGKPVPEIFEAYKYVVYRRLMDTQDYMRDRLNAKKEKQNQRSCISKCGGLMKTLMVYGFVLSIILPMLYETWHKLQTGGKSSLEDEYEIINTKHKDGQSAERLTPEEIAKRAQEAEARKEAEFSERVKAYESEMGIHEEDQAEPEEEEDWLEEPDSTQKEEL